MLYQILKLILSNSFLSNSLYQILPFLNTCCQVQFFGECNFLLQFNDSIVWQNCKIERLFLSINQPFNQSSFEKRMHGQTSWYPSLIWIQWTIYIELRSVERGNKQ